MFKKLIKRHALALSVLTAVYWAVLLLATSLPSRSLPNVPCSDKVLHFFAFFILAALVNVSLLAGKSRPPRQTTCLTFFVTTSYAALDELHQLLVPGRSCDSLDFLADLLGASLGIALVYFLLVATARRIPAE